jgi:hypothetical protein
MLIDTTHTTVSNLEKLFSDFQKNLYRARCNKPYDFTGLYLQKDTSNLYKISFIKTLDSKRKKA